MPNFWRSVWTSVKSNQKLIFILLIFLLKSTPCWLTYAQLHHWGHTNVCTANKNCFSYELKSIVFFINHLIQWENGGKLASFSTWIPFWRIPEESFGHLICLICRQENILFAGRFLATFFCGHTRYCILKI